MRQRPPLARGGERPPERERLMPGSAMRPRTGRRTTLAAAAVLALGLLAETGPAAAAQATVAVATNFLVPLRSLAEEFADRTGHSLRISSGSTGQLYAQITNGAPYDVFLSADAARPLRLEKAGATLPGTRRTYALGRIVLWSAEPGRVDAGGAEALGTLGNAKIAIANPEVAPYGVASQETLERLGFWEPLQDRIVRGINVAQVFQFIGTENAAMGFIAMSQLAGRPKGGEGSIWLVPTDLHGPIRQDMVLMKRAEGNEAAFAFLDFLAAPDILARIESFGYSIPAQ